MGNSFSISYFAIRSISIQLKVFPKLKKYIENFWEGKAHNLPILSDYDNGGGSHNHIN